VLAVGDAAFQRKCMAFARSLEKKGSTILFVSHNMFSIKSMCQRVIYLKKGKVAFDGPTNEGLKLYEADSRLKDVHWFHRDDGDPPVTFTDAEIISSAGSNAGVVDHGERLTIRLRYATTRRIERPDIRISIDREDDLHTMTFSTSADGVDIPFLEGEGEITVTTPPIALTSDFYLSNVAVREGGIGKLVAAQIVGHFHVRHPVFSSTAYGAMHEAGDWKHTGAGAAPAAPILTIASKR
jgi:lipopolysaccharide transport system ATP-binding protein